MNVFVLVCVCDRLPINLPINSFHRLLTTEKRECERLQKALNNELARVYRDVMT